MAFGTVSSNHAALTCSHIIFFIIKSQTCPVMWIVLLPSVVFVGTIFGIHTIVTVKHLFSFPLFTHIGSLNNYMFATVVTHLISCLLPCFV